MQCRSRPAGVWATRSPKNSTKFSDRVESVTQPATVPSCTSRPANKTARAVSLVLELAPAGDAGDGGLGGIDPGLGLHARLLVHAPDDGVLRRVQVQPADVAGLFPEVWVVTRHLGLDLPGFQIERPTDAPALRGRDRHAVGGHLSGEGFHRPTRRVVRRRLGDELHQQQHVVMAIDAGTPRSFDVVETGQAELDITLTPEADLVVVQVDDLADLTVGAAVGGQQDDARSLRRPCFDRARTCPRLENRTVTLAELQGRESHDTRKPHQCY